MCPESWTNCDTCLSSNCPPRITATRDTDWQKCTCQNPYLVISSRTIFCVPPNDTGWKVGERENNSGSMILTNPYLKPEPQNSHCSLALNHVWRSLKHFPSAYGLNSVPATANQENDPSQKRRCVACPSKYMVMNNVCLDGAITRPLRAVKSARIAVNSPSQFCLLTVHHRGRWWPLPERNSIPSRSSGLKFSFLSALSQIQTYETIPASTRLMTHK